MQSISNSDSIVLRKPVEALVMVPRVHKLSALGRKMYNVMLYISQVSLKTMDGTPSATHLFQAPMQEVLKVCGAERQNSHAKKYLTEMRNTDVIWNSPDEDSETQNISFNLLSESRITKKENAVWIHWALPPSLIEALSDPTRWASIDLIVMSRLETYAAIVLYEICTKYRNNPSHLSCHKSPEWWMQGLLSSPVPVDPVTGQKKFIEWRKFKNKYLNSAIEQINSYSDLHIELIENRSGKKLVEVQFRVFIKDLPKHLETDKDTSDTESVSEDVLKYAKTLGVEDKEVINLTANQDKESVIYALRKLEERQRQLTLPLVKSPTKYFKSIIEQEKAQPDVRPKPSIKAKQDSHPARLNSTVPLVTPSLDEVLTPFKDTTSPDLEMILKEKQGRIFSEIITLPADDVQQWLSLYAEMKRSKGLLTPSIQRRLASSDWHVGIVKSEVIDFYALSKYGENWLAA